MTGFYLTDGTPCKYADSKQVSKDNYRLQHDLVYKADSGVTYIVKEGFIHDGASKGFLRHFGDYTNAAILHDALYKTHLESRKISDDLFFEAMQKSGVGGFIKWSHWGGVRVGGWWAYRSKSKESINENLKYIERIQDEA